MITKKFIKQTLLVLGLMAAAFALLAIPAAFAAGLVNPGDLPPNLQAAGGGETSLRVIIVNIINYFLGFLGLIAVIMILYGGFTYMTAGGKQESVDNAKKTILYALVGIVIILLSFAIVNTVLGVATSDTPAAVTPGATTPLAPAAPAQ